MAPGKAYAFNYRLTWPFDVARSWAGARVHATRTGLSNGPQRKTGDIQFAVDFKGLPANSAGEFATGSRRGQRRCGRQCTYCPTQS